MQNKKNIIRVMGVGTVGQKGQVVIPKEAREALGIVPGDPVTFMIKDDTVLGIIPNNSMDDLMKYMGTECDIKFIK